MQPCDGGDERDRRKINMIRMETRGRDSVISEDPHLEERIDSCRKVLPCRVASALLFYLQRTNAEMTLVPLGLTTPFHYLCAGHVRSFRKNILLPGSNTSNCIYRDNDERRGRMLQGLLATENRTYRNDLVRGTIHHLKELQDEPRWRIWSIILVRT